MHSRHPGGGRSPDGRTKLRSCLQVRHGKRYNHSHWLKWPRFNGVGRGDKQVVRRCLKSQCSRVEASSRQPSYSVAGSRRYFHNAAIRRNSCRDTHQKGEVSANVLF